MDIRGWPLIDRKKELRTIVPTRGSRLLYVDHIVGRGEDMFTLRALTAQAEIPERLEKLGMFKRVPILRAYLAWPPSYLCRPRDQVGKGVFGPLSLAGALSRITSFHGFGLVM